jgi:hypothetical protein
MTYQKSLVSVLVIVTEYSHSNVDINEFSSFLGLRAIPHEILVINNNPGNSIRIVPPSPDLDDYLRNLEVINLKRVSEIDAVTILGLEQSIGDTVIVFDPNLDSFEVIDQMRKELDEATDVVYAVNIENRHPNYFYRLAEKMYEYFYFKLTSIRIGKDATRFRIMKRLVVNHILQQSNPIGTYRSLPNITGFTTKSISYEASGFQGANKSLAKSVKYGLSLAIETSHLPIRIVNFGHLLFTSSFLIFFTYRYLASEFANRLPERDIFTLYLAFIIFLFSLTFNLISEYILSLLRTIERRPQLFSTKSFALKNQTHLLNVLDPNDSRLNDE